MPDIDVAALSLAVPPTSAPVATYRPAVLTKNNGVAPAPVSGTLRIYDKAAGTLVQSMSLSPATIPAGQSRQVFGSGYWTALLANVGKHFLFLAEVTTPGDQVPGNNNLGPIDVLVSSEEPPPPQPVEDHAEQHENGGGDELNLDGLPGVLAEGQRPTDHAENHQAGGSDQLSVAGLSGLLTDPQTPNNHAFTHATGGIDPVSDVTPSPHASSHEPGGADPIEAFEPGPHHLTHEIGSDDEITSIVDVKQDLSNHTLAESGVHDAALNLEHVANKGAAGGYCPLGPDSVVPGDNLPTQFPTTHHANHEQNGSDEIDVTGLKGILANDQPPAEHGDGAHSEIYEKVQNKGAANGYCGLNAGAKIDPANVDLPVHGNDFHEQDYIDAGFLEDYQPTAQKGAANGYCGLNASAKIDPANVDLPVHGNDMHEQDYITAAALEDYQQTVQKGAANGYAPLDADAKVPATNLPTMAGGGKIAYGLAAPTASQDISNGSWVALINGAALPADTPDVLAGSAIVDIEVDGGTVADRLTAFVQVIVDGFSSGTAEQDYMVNSPLDIVSLAAPFKRDNPPQLTALTVRVKLAGLSQGIARARCSACLLMEGSN